MHKLASFILGDAYTQVVDADAQVWRRGNLG